MFDILELNIRLLCDRLDYGSRFQGGGVKWLEEKRDQDFISVFVVWARFSNCCTDQGALTSQGIRLLRV